MRGQSQQFRESRSRHLSRASGKQNDSQNQRRPTYNAMASPLKPALDLAVSKVVSGMNSSRVQVSGQQAGTERSRVTYCQTERTPNKRKNLGYSRVDNKSPLAGKMHPQTQAFLRKHFPDLEAIPIDQFVQIYMEEHSQLWSDKGDIADDLFAALKDSLGDGEYLDVGKLGQLTRSNGPIGIIIEVCKRLQVSENQEQQPQVTNLKNIIQEFMESMYKKLENELYTKFNAEMRRMVLRAKQAQKLLKDVNDQITSHYDIFSKREGREANRLNKDLARQRENNHILQEKINLISEERDQLVRQNQRLSQTINKCHQHFLAKQKSSSDGHQQQIDRQAQLQAKSQLETQRLLTLQRQAQAQAQLQAQKLASAKAAAASMSSHINSQPYPTYYQNQAKPGLGMSMQVSHYPSAPAPSAPSVQNSQFVPSFTPSNYSSIAPSPSYTSSSFFNQPMSGYGISPTQSSMMGVGMVNVGPGPMSMGGGVRPQAPYGTSSYLSPTTPSFGISTYVPGSTDYTSFLGNKYGTENPKTQLGGAFREETSKAGCSSKTGCQSGSGVPQCMNCLRRTLGLQNEGSYRVHYSGTTTTTTYQ